MSMAGPVWVATVGVLLASCGRPYPPPAPPRQTNLAVKISRLELSNGLRVVLVTDPRAAEVQVTMQYRVGSVDDPPDQAGVAHLVEHLMFDQVLGAQSLFARLEDITTFFNAFTTLDATTYVARAHPSQLEDLLAIEAVRVGFRCTSITDAAFVRERQVVVNELRERDSTTEVLTALHGGLYADGHPYRRPTGGSQASVGAITREQACAFADAHYAPSNAVLVVSGHVTEAQLEAALKRFLSKLPRREVVGRTAIPRPDARPGHSEVAMPIDHASLLVAWPLPEEPQLRAKVRAIAVATSAIVDSHVKGLVVQFEIGGTRAPMIAIAVLSTTDEPMDNIRAATHNAVDSVESMFRATTGDTLGQIVFNQIQQTAIYKLFATLEEGGDRDSELAAHVLAGLDPSATLGAEIRGLRTMTPQEAGRIAREYLSFGRATVVVLQPSETVKRGTEVTLAAPIHDIGHRREPADPTEAARPLPPSPMREVEAMTSRTLPNGLRIVLLPLTSVPTVDVRLIFGSGTADEPVARRGVAMIAARALTFDLRHLNDFLLFAAAGGTNRVELSEDQTAFAANGLDMHLDYLLAGLRRWIRDGEYSSDTAAIVNTMRSDKGSRDEGALTDAWRSALFGAAHPYVRAGIGRHLSDTLTIDDVLQFRKAHYTPDNATLVIAGRFDAALADRWIDHLFLDWRGVTAPRVASPSVLQPSSIAKDDATVLTHVRIAIPATTGNRAEQLVATAMLSDLARDVRHQLGASYHFVATLDESRLATNYVISGSVDTSRASEAIELLRTRLDKLRIDPDTAARAFVSARRRTANHLVATAGSATTLGNRVQRDINLGRAPLSDFETTKQVGALTIQDMTATVTALELSRAAILMRGPAADVDRAFAILGRTPVHMPATVDNPKQPSTATLMKPPRDSDFSLSDLEEPLTLQGPPTRWTLTATAGYALGRVITHNVSGFMLGGDVGYRLSRKHAVGVNVALGRLRGTYDVGRFVEDLRPVGVTSYGLAGFLRTSDDRLWGGLVVGLRLERVTDDGMAKSYNSLAVGLEGGFDVLRSRRQRLGAYARFDTDLLSGADYASITMGLAYRQ